MLKKYKNSYLMLVEELEMVLAEVWEKMLV